LSTALCMGERKHGREIVDGRGWRWQRRDAWHMTEQSETTDPVLKPRLLHIYMGRLV
jgi:hypothetical protein